MGGTGQRWWVYAQVYAWSILFWLDLRVGVHCLLTLFSPSDHGVAGFFGICGDAVFCIPCDVPGSIMLRWSCSVRRMVYKPQHTKDRSG